jgi:lipoate-protein ligase A
VNGEAASPMRLINLSHDEPAMNLALDEALLESVAAGQAGDTVRLWESPVPFVVLGTGQQAAVEANLAGCAAAGVPVLRRCSAGGCVLQGVGSLNYAVVLDLHQHPEARSLHASYCVLLNQLRAAFKARGCVLDHAGTSDLAMDAKKVSGNAQRRKRDAILHHGTLVYAPDYAGMARYLSEPEERPEYRGSRRHEDFVGSLPFSRGEIESIVAEAFGADSPVQPSEWEAARAEELAIEKYRLAEWNLRR